MGLVLVVGLRVAGSGAAGEVALLGPKGEVMFWVWFYDLFMVCDSPQPFMPVANATTQWMFRWEYLKFHKLPGYREYMNRWHRFNN